MRPAGGANGGARSGGGRLARLLALVGGARADRRRLVRAVRTIDPMAFSIKQHGYALARELADALPPPVSQGAQHAGLAWKPSTQADLESAWAAHWLVELATPLVFHRTLWELCYVLQALHEGGMLRAGARGLGFGCGTEVIPSYLAARGVAVTVTDLPPDTRRAIGWAASGQHARAPEQAFHPHLVDRATFDRLVDLRHVDMIAIPPDLAGYDFCWSVCALEHLGSIARGQDFVVDALSTLRPGGIAVHTTELNIRSDGPTQTSGATVLFQRRHIEALAARLRAGGHIVAPIDFALGDRPLDRFVDLPPYPHDLPDELNAWFGPPAHMKLALDGHVATCFGIVVRKAPG